MKKMSLYLYTYFGFFITIKSIPYISSSHICEEELTFKNQKVRTSQKIFLKNK